MTLKRDNASEYYRLWRYSEAEISHLRKFMHRYHPATIDELREQLKSQSDINSHLTEENMALEEECERLRKIIQERSAG